MKMAWNPNEKGTYAWFTKEASNHGGVENYISDIEENAKVEAHTEDMIKLLWIIPIVSTLSVLGKTIYDNIKQKIVANKELKQKSDVAKETLINELESEESIIEENDSSNPNDD